MRFRVWQPCGIRQSTARPTRTLVGPVIGDAGVLAFFAEYRQALE